VSARERILARVRDALAERPRAPDPGRFRGERPEPPPTDLVRSFIRIFESSGGEVHRLSDHAAARAWLTTLVQDARGVCIGATVPPTLLPDVAAAPPRDAEIGISMAVGAVAETGSLILDARDGRLTQLLPPTHAVLLRADTVYPTLVDALAHLRSDLPSALALHSGPSKSADIGQILVEGVHGPGRIFAVIIGG